MQTIYICFTTLSFCGFYLSAIFIIISEILLAFEQLERVANNRRLYDIIEKLGVDIKGRKMLIFKELSVFYMVPLIFPIVVFAIIVIRSQELFGRAGLPLMKCRLMEKHYKTNTMNL